MLDSTGSRFRTYIGIDYLGAGRPDSQQKMLQFYERRSSYLRERLASTELEAFSDNGTLLKAEKHEGCGVFGLLVQGID